MAMVSPGWPPHAGPGSGPGRPHGHQDVVRGKFASCFQGAPRLPAQRSHPRRLRRARPSGVAVPQQKVPGSGAQRISFQVGKRGT